MILGRSCGEAASFNGKPKASAFRCTLRGEGQPIDARSECLAPLAPVLRGEGLGVRGDPRLTFYAHTHATAQPRHSPA